MPGLGRFISRTPPSPSNILRRNGRNIYLSPQGMVNHGRLPNWGGYREEEKVNVTKKKTMKRNKKEKVDKSKKVKTHKKNKINSRKK